MQFTFFFLFGKTSVAPRLVSEVGDHQALEVVALVTFTNLRVDTAQMLLKVAFNLTLVWLEPRVTYVNLKSDSRYISQQLWCDQVR